MDTSLDLETEREIIAWIATECKIVNTSSTRIYDLFNSWQKWAQNNNMTKKSFSLALAALGYKRYQTWRGREFQRLELRTPAPDPVRRNNPEWKRTKYPTMPQEISDEMPIWIKKLCVEGKNEKQSTQELYQSWKNCPPGTRFQKYLRPTVKSFSLALSSRGYSRRRNAKGSYFVGIRLKTI